MPQAQWATGQPSVVTPTALHRVYASRTTALRRAFFIRVLNAHRLPSSGFRLRRPGPLDVACGYVRDVYRLRGASGVSAIAVLDSGFDKAAILALRRGPAAALVPGSSHAPCCRVRGRVRLTWSLPDRD